VTDQKLKLKPVTIVRDGMTITWDREGGLVKLSHSEWIVSGGQKGGTLCPHRIWEFAVDFLGLDVRINLEVLFIFALSYF